MGTEAEANAPPVNYVQPSLDLDERRADMDGSGPRSQEGDFATVRHQYVHHLHVAADADIYVLVPLALCLVRLIQIIQKR